MDARTVQKLLRCVQSPDDRVTMTAALDAFCAEHPTIGRRKGNYLLLLDSDKETLRQILLSDGINPETSPDAWAGKTRAESLALGNDEKLTNEVVKRRRVAVKALRPAAWVDLGRGPLYLPPRCDIGIDQDEVSVAAHDWIIVVENWEAFVDIHVAADRLMFPGRSPLVVFRGDTSDTRADALLCWLSKLSQPIAAFVDYDPAGLVIASVLPRLDAFVAPALDELEFLVKEKGLHSRFQAQLPMCQRMLDERAHPLVRSVWSVLRQAGKALPQEHFVKPSLS